MDAKCSTYVETKDYKFNQVLLESQEIKLVVRVVAVRILKNISRNIEQNFMNSEEKGFGIWFALSLAI